MSGDGEGRDLRIGTRVLAGTALALLLVVGAGGWAATAKLSSAVIGPGSVAVDENLKSVQHRDGGIVAEIAVREGDAVEAGQVLFRLDDAQTRAELAIVEARVTELAARRSRLLAERDGLDRVSFPEALENGGSASEELIAGETRLFDGKHSERKSRKAQLELGIDQIGEEILGLEAQRDSKLAEIELVEDEYARTAELARKGLIEAARLHAVSRERARLRGERGEIDAAIGRAGMRISEIRLQIIAIDEASRTEAQAELALVEAELAELGERRAAIRDLLSRTDIRAPIAGTVNELNIHTIGGVITPAEVVATLVPEDAELKVAVRIPPVQIDRVSVGQPARLRFSALDQRTTPELEGWVVHLSPATARDAATGETFFLADVQVPEAELAKLGGARLLPGMPVEVYITTEARTALSYFIKPVSDQFARAFRER